MPTPKFKRRLNNTGNISKLSGNRSKPYRVLVSTGEMTFSDNGKARYIKKCIGTYATYNEAEYALALYNRNPQYTKKGFFTVKQVLDQWLESIKGKKSDNTLKSYTSQAKHLEPIYEKDIESLDIIECQALLDNVEGDTSKRLVKLLLKSIIEYAPALNLNPKNITQNLFIPTHQKKQNSIFTTDEIRGVWELYERISNDRINKGSGSNGYMKNSDILVRMLLIMLYSGMRISEVLEVHDTPDKVFLDKRYLIGGIKTEAGINREIPIREEILPIIEEYMNMKMPYTQATIPAIMSKFLKDNKINHHSHEARHTFISLAMTAKLPLPVIQQIVGHTSGSVTVSVYTHIPICDKIKAVDSINFT